MQSYFFGGSGAGEERKDALSKNPPASPVWIRSPRKPTPRARKNQLRMPPLLTRGAGIPAARAPALNSADVRSWPTPFQLRSHSSGGLEYHGGSEYHMRTHCRCQHAVTSAALAVCGRRWVNSSSNFFSDVVCVRRREHGVQLLLELIYDNNIS